jgi:glutaconate CoA-transferase subunit A
VVTVEEVVETFAGRHVNACILPRWTIAAIAVVPGGAFPSYAFGYYARDNAFYKAWDEISRTRESFTGWMDEHVMQAGPEAFASRSHQVA